MYINCWKEQNCARRCKATDQNIWGFLQQQQQTNKSMVSNAYICLWSIAERMNINTSKLSLSLSPLSFFLLCVYCILQSVQCGKLKQITVELFPPGSNVIISVLSETLPTLNSGEPRHNYNLIQKRLRFQRSSAVAKYLKKSGFNVHCHDKIHRIQNCIWNVDCIYIIEVRPEKYDIPSSHSHPNGCSILCVFVWHCVTEIAAAAGMLTANRCQ